MDRYLKASPSQIDTFLRCPREWLWEYYFKIEPLSPSTRGSKADAGSLFHEGLQILYDGKTLEEAKAVIRASEKEQFKKIGEKEILIPPYIAQFEHLSLERILLALDHYYQRYFTPKDEFTPLGSELYFDLPITSYFGIEGILDLVAKDFQGRYLAIDHKTSGFNSKIFFEGERRGFQLPIYSYALKQIYQLDYWPSIIINGIFWSTVKADKSKFLPQLIRSSYSLVEREIDLKMKELLEVLNRMLEYHNWVYERYIKGVFQAEEACLHFHPNPENCTRWNKLCLYHLLCDSYGGSLFNQNLQYFQKRVNLRKEELKNE